MPSHSLMRSLFASHLHEEIIAKFACLQEVIRASCLLAGCDSIYDTMPICSCVDQLLDAGFPADGADARGCTPLHICQCAHTAGMLTHRGASVRTLCGAGATPLHWAAGAGRLCAPKGSPHTLSSTGVPGARVRVSDRLQALCTCAQP